MNNKSAILIETTANTTDNLRPRSGSWSGYQYYSTQPPLLPQQQQQTQPTSPHEYNKPIKQTFLTKFIQKRPPTNPSQHEPQPIPTMQPMLSTPLLKKQDFKKKKGGSFGRFLKKFNKNPTDKTTTSDNTLMGINDENEMDKKDENMVPKNINDNETNDNDNHDNDIRNNSQQQPIDDNMLINDAMKMPRQTHKPTIVHENFGHADYHQPIVPTFNNNTMIPDFNSHHEHHHHHHPYANNISTDDIHLKYQYNYKPDVTMYTPLVPRSTSFDVNRSSHSPPPIRLFTPLNQNSLLKPTTFINNNNPIHHDNNSNNKATVAANTTGTATITDDDPTYSKKPTLEEDLIEDEDDDDDDDTNDSIDSDMEDHINVERLSKRLSGGHYGSAGGLIVNTLSLSEIAKHDYIQNNNNNNEDTEEETEEEDKINQETVNSELKQNENQDENEINDINSNSNNNKICDYINNDKSDIIENEKQISSSSSTPSLSPMEISPVIVEENNISKLGHAGNNESESTSTKEINTLIEHKKDNEDNLNKQSIDNDSSMKQEAEKNDDIESDDDDDNTSIEMKTEDIARRILELDDTVYHDLEHVAEWIGDGSLASNQILKHYMALFDFTNRRLEDSFRQLCGKLPMKAESQQIDRILEEFSKRYWDCNQSELFGSSDVIHAIIYSLVLLNTDLHIAQGEHKKMSRPAFVRNTMDAIRSQLDVLNKDSLILEEEDKHASFLSLQSTSQQSSSTTPQEWTEIKRTPSVRSAYSQHSGTHHPSSSKYTSMDTMMMKTSSPTSPASSTIIIGSKTWQTDMETLLKQMYNSIRHRQLLHPTFKNNIVDQSDLKRNSLNGSSSSSKLSPFKRGIGSTMWKAARESLFLSDSHSHSTTTLSTEVDYAQQPLSPRSAVSSLSGTFPRRRSISSIRSGLSHHSQHTNHGNGTTTYQAVASLLHRSNLPTSFTSSAPYYKEGLIARKHLMERANHKARQRDWKECFMVVDRGELRMYRLDGQSHGRRKINNHHHNNNSSLILGSNNSRQQHLQGMISRGSLATVSESISSFDPNSEVVLGGGDWLANAQIIGEIDLKHTLANSLPSGYNRQRQHAFALQQSNGGVYLFQVGSAEQVLEWVDTCNYWAARESKEPLLGGVGNVEYGWGACLNGISDEDDDNDHSSSSSSSSSSAIIVHQWQPPFPPMVASVLGEVEQLDALHQHIKSLNKELDNHRDIKHKMEKKFPRKTSDHVCAMSNFENKTQYLLHEIIKYQNYCDSIEKSLDLQDKALDEKKQQQLSSEEIKSTATTTITTTTTTTTVESKPTTTIIV